jgi:hypothetical protein
MSIWNKILLGLIFVASLAFFHAAARTVKTYEFWSRKANDFENTLTKRSKELHDLLTADHEHKLDDKTIGVQQLRIDLGRVLASRGRIWTKCEKQRATATPAGIMKVDVTTDESTPSTFAKNMLLYGFEEGDDQSPGKYLGEFRVDGTSERKISLFSTTQMAPAVAKNITDSKGSWVLYELMPTDEYETFENLTEDQKKMVTDAFAKLPADQKKSVTDEFLGDSQGDAGGKKTKRPLRDYLAIFRDCEIHEALFLDRMAATKRDAEYLAAAKEETEKQYALVEKETTQVSGEKERARLELAAVTQLYAVLQRMLGFNQTAVQNAIENNLKLAQDIARRQKEAADLIDRRARAMAQLGPGAN